MKTFRFSPEELLDLSRFPAMSRLKLLIFASTSQGLIGTAGPAVEGDSLDVTEPMQPTIKDKLRMAQQSIPSSMSDSITVAKYVFIFWAIVVGFIYIKRWRSRRGSVEKSVV